MAIAVNFSEEFDIYLDQIQIFFAEQGIETLNWWYTQEDTLIDYLEQTLSSYPFIGQLVEKGPFKGFRRITYGKSTHIMLNYLIYYEVHEDSNTIIVINILPSRSKGARVK